MLRPVLRLVAGRRGLPESVFLPSSLFACLPAPCIMFLLSLFYPWPVQSYPAVPTRVATPPSLARLLSPLVDDCARDEHQLLPPR